MPSIPIADIRIGERHRKNIGDLSTLAASIKSEGLLQEIGISPDRVLVFGERRLRACHDLSTRLVGHPGPCRQRLIDRSR